MIKPRKLAFSFHYAFEGIYFAFVCNQNLWIHVVIAIIAIVLGIILKLSAFEIGLLGITILLVICAEMVNTSIEEMVNLITSEHRAEAKIAKDVSAGMVLLTAIGSVLIGIIIFVPHILTFLH